jgi:hypothetical protein
MSDRKKNIADRFSGFEPDVDNSTIDKSWEKIKYFLPQEKKRRAMVWFKNKGLGRTLGVLLTLGLISGLAGLFLHSRETEKTLAVAHENKAANTVNELKTDSEKAQKNRPGALQNTSEIQPALAKSSGNTPAIKEKNPVPENKRVKAQSASAGPGISEGAGSAPAAVPADEDHESMDPVKEKYPSTPLRVTAVKAANPITSEALAYEQLHPLFLSRISTDRNDSIPLSFMEIKRDETPLAPIFRKWSIELFGGPCLSNTQIRYGEEMLAPDKRPLDFSLGLGLVFQLTRKWSVYANGRFGRNSFEYEKELQVNRVVDKQTYTQSATPLIAADTIIRYLPSTSYHQVSSAPVYNVGVGAGYSLLRKSKISLEVSLGLSLKYSTYQTGIRIIQQQDQDTLRYTRTSTSPPLANEIRFSGEYDQKQTFISWGLAPGLAMVYQFHSRLGFIARPSGFIQFSKNNSQSRQEPYRLQQNNLFLDVGLRIKI